MSDVEITDNRIECQGKMNGAITSWLYEASSEIVSQVADRTRVDSGQLKGSWTYEVDESTGESTVGSPLENAIWEEFGTGIYAVNGDGRKNAWWYMDKDGEYVLTNGKKPNRALETGFNSAKNKIQRILENIFKGLE